jgi:cysteinyl-tRNA synthetase
VKEPDINPDEIKSLLVKYGLEVEAKSAEEGVDILLKRREDARKEKDWGTADSIRDDLKKLGIEVEDTKSGAVWYIKRRF